MRRSLVACAALFLACNSAPTDTGKTTPTKAGDAKTGRPDTKAKPDAKTPDVEAPDTKAPDAKVPDTKAPDAKAPDAKAPEPTPPPVKLSEATTALLDRLVPAADRVVVDEAAAKRLEIKVEENHLWVVDGSRRAPLDPRGDAVHGVTVVTGSSGEPTLRIEHEDSVFCGDTRRTVELPARALLARLEHASGAEHLGKSKGKGKGKADPEAEAAARAFAQAVLLDPSLDDAWIDLARALAKQGDTASAMAALDPMIARTPLETYHHVLSESDLASLREQPAIVALRAPKAGDAKVGKLTIAHSAHLSMVALRRQEPSWGACNYVEDLRLFDAGTGDPVLTLPLVGWLDAEPECGPRGGLGKIKPAQRAEVKARTDAAERFLRDMGFTVSSALELVEPKKAAPGDAIKEAQLPGVGLDVVIDDTSVSLRKGGEVLATKPQEGAEGIELVGHDPVARVVFVKWWLSVPEGCAFDRDGRGFYVLPVPASK